MPEIWRGTDSAGTRVWKPSVQPQPMGQEAGWWGDGARNVSVKCQRPFILHYYQPPGFTAVVGLNYHQLLCLSRVFLYFVFLFYLWTLSARQHPCTRTGFRD